MGKGTNLTSKEHGKIAGLSSAGRSVLKTAIELDHSGITVRNYLKNFLLTAKSAKNLIEKKKIATRGTKIYYRLARVGRYTS